MKDKIKNGVLIIYLEGNMIGTYASGPLIDLITKNIESGNKKVLFNLSEMKFIDSTGLGMLLITLFKTRKAGGEMALCNVPGKMHELLQITRLDDVFIQHPDEETALAFLMA